jgi:hypothetical protein
MVAAMDRIQDAEGVDRSRLDRLRAEVEDP